MLFFRSYFKVTKMWNLLSIIYSPIQHVLITPNSSEVVKYGNQEDTVQAVETRVSWRNIVDDPVEYVEVTSFYISKKATVAQC